MYKKVFFLFIVIIVSFCQQETFATSSFAPFIEVKKIPNFSDSNLSVLSHLSIKQIESLTGRKLNLKERFALKIYKSKPALFNQYIDSTEEKKLEKKALWSKWLGIGSLIGLFIPGINLLSLPAAIIAIVFGISTQDKVKDKKNSRQGITFGIITLGIIVLLVALVVVIVAALVR